MVCIMQPIFGQPLKRVHAWVGGAAATQGDTVISHYGLESGLIYKQGRALRQRFRECAADAVVTGFAARPKY